MCRPLIVLTPIDFVSSSVSLDSEVPWSLDGEGSYPFVDSLVTPVERVHPDWFPSGSPEMVLDEDPFKAYISSLSRSLPPQVFRVSSLIT